MSSETETIVVKQNFCKYPLAICRVITQKPLISNTKLSTVLSERSWKFGCTTQPTYPSETETGKMKPNQSQLED